MKRTGLNLFIAGFWLLVSGFYIPLHAQDETLTLLTYYPAPYGVYQTLELMRDSASTTLTISAYHNTESTSPTLTFRKADNTMAIPQPVDNTARLGTINFQGYDNDSFDTGASIYAIADANWGASERGTELRFQTRDENASLTDQMTIAANGDVSFQNMPGIAYDNYFIKNVNPQSGSWQTYGQLTVSVPADGYLLVQANGDMYTYNTSNTNLHMEVGIAETNNGTPPAGASLDAEVARDEVAPGDPNISVPFAVSRVYSVSTGSKTFYIVGRNTVPAYRLEIKGSTYAIYFPVEYNP